MFIPNEVVKEGDRVRLTRSMHVFAGTYTKDSQFTVASVGVRGPKLVDEDGDYVLETGFMTDSMEVWRGEWVPIMKRY